MPSFITNFCVLMASVAAVWLPCVAQGQPAGETELHAHLLRQLHEDELSREERTAALATLAKALHGPDSDRVLVGFRQLVRRDCRGLDEVLPAFADLLHRARSHDSLQWEKHLCDLVETLAAAGHAPAEVVAELESVVQAADKFRFAAPKAAAALLEMYPQRPDLMQWFDERLQGQERHARMAAAAALGSTGKAAERLAPRLSEMLKDPAPEVRVLAAAALRKAGRHSPEVVLALRRSLGEGPAAVVTAPTTVSESGLDHRHIAVGNLGEMGPASRAAADDIAGLLEDADPLLRIIAAQALGQTGARAAAVVAALEKAANDADRSVAAAAAQALRRLRQVER